MKNNIKKKKESLMGLAKESMGLGIVSMAGMGAMGAMGAVPGMPTQSSQVTQTVGIGLTLANVGQVGRIGMALPGLMGANNKKKKTGNSIIDKII